MNPVAQLETMHSRAPEMRFFSTTSFEVKPVRGLTLKSDFTADLDVLETDAFQPVIDVPGGSTTTLREQEHTRTFHYLWETTATYAEVFGKHHISAMAGFTTDYKKLRLYDFRTQNYPSDTWDKYQNLWQNGSWYRDPTENYYEYAMVSFLARLGYSFDDRYFLTASIRRDASSKLPSSKNYDWFPAVSGAWKLSSEKFFANSSLAGVFDLIKIRAGWGMVGNVDLYPNTSSVDVPLSIYPDGSLIGGNTVYGSYYDTIANPGATWETTVQTSAGIDLTLLKNTLDISVDYYDKETRDLVDYVPTPPQMGVTTSPMGNMGRVTNKGWEFSVAFRNTGGARASSIIASGATSRPTRATWKSTVRSRSCDTKIPTSTASRFSIRASDIRGTPTTSIAPTASSVRRRRSTATSARTPRRARSCRCSPTPRWAT